MKDTIILTRNEEGVSDEVKIMPCGSEFIGIRTSIKVMSSPEILKAMTELRSKGFYEREDTK